MIPILSIVGRSNSGKTTLIEKLIPELIKRGYRVGTIKHNKKGFDIDREGKDSWRHQLAGATVTVLSSPTCITLIEKTISELSSVAQICDEYIRNVDIVICEGYKENNYNKIEMYRSDRNDTLMYENSENLLAIVGDKSPKGIFRFFTSDEVVAIVDLVEQKFLK